MKRSIVLLCGSLAASIGFAESGTLTLEQALALARNNSPELRTAELNARSAARAVDAAGRWMNPRLKFEAEGVGGDLELFGEGEYTLGIAQEFQLGGRQRHARGAAAKAVAIAGHHLSEVELERDDQVRQAFVEVLALQESGKVQAEQEELGRAFVEVAGRLHQRGGGSELDVVQAELELEKILFSQSCCLGELLAARERLASLVGLPESELGELAGDYYQLEKIDGLGLADTHPALMRLAAEADLLRAEARLAKTKDAGHLTLEAGYRHEAESDVNSLVFSASIPLGLHKQGRVEQAAMLMQAEAMEAARDAMRRRLQSALAEAVALYQGAVAQADMGKQKLIPKAEQAYELSREGYRAGRFSWMELIAAQQHLVEIRLQYIDVLKEAHLARLEILKLKAKGI
ncbi:MAG: TolC family protein [Pontiella sp.]|nr:TolC family protein [Pontiella sp.]